MSYSSVDHTFVVCAYRDNPFLANTIRSLQNQTVASNVVVSTSTPSPYIERVCSECGVKMIVNPNPHYAGDDWNFGYNSANSKLVTIAHQDDSYSPTFLEKTIECFNSYPKKDVSITFTDYYEIKNGSRVNTNLMLIIKRAMNRLFLLPNNGSVFLKKTVLRFGCPICCPSVTLNKEILGPSVFDTTLRDSCDYKTWVKLASINGRFCYISEMLMGHRIYADSATSKNLSENIRTGETLSILCELWPEPIARFVNRFYATSERLNNVD